MKKLALFLAIAGIALTSCNGSYTVAKRKYNKGFYVNRSTGNKIKNQDVAQQKTIKAAELVKTEVILPENKTEVSVIETASINQPVKSFAKQAEQKNTKTTKNFTSAQTVASANTNYAVQHVNFKKLDISKSEIKAAHKKGSDTDLIIQIILALFPILCLIAVYLHDGKSVTLNFWIDLLLHLTFIGEIIFAILVVLDVIDLK